MIILEPVVCASVDSTLFRLNNTDRLPVYLNFLIKMNKIHVASL